MKLIKIKKQNKKEVVSAKELHEFLEIKTHLSTWVKRCIDKYDFVEGVDFEVFKFEKHNSDNKMARPQESIDYRVTLDMAKELSMISDTPRGKEARKYFIECEKNYIKSLQERIDTFDGIKDRVELTLLQGATDTIDYLQKSIKEDLAVLDRTMRRINDHRAHILLYNGSIRDMIKRLKTGDYFTKEQVKVIKRCEAEKEAERKAIREKLF